ncbi:hypothetical protein GB928_025185 [Shinella curvata]|uniref:Phage tail protein n=1 Tax=Shinella curvata TaxID=1817964 RepID=A0ABT8XL88_9HYPH|nr:hypothetical protein [Shinella curvata]MCJ8056668.1 hypothetical protein [Shinella curvata]MDO6124492.1 hypothetical protein [Shinella curvata]
MLYLNPPFFEYEGVVVGRDYSDPKQFWYYPNRPRIGTDEQGRPAVRLIVYKEILENLEATDDEVAAGFLLFDTVLDWEPERLKRVAARIKDEMDLDDLPRLAPLQYRSGRVRMTFLDRKSPLPGDPPPGEDVPDSEWVSFLESSGVPSLYADNRAIFSVELTAKGTRFILGSFDGFIPAGVVYELNYVAMQRAYNVKVEADWNLVYEYIRDYEQDRFFFWNDEIEKIVEKLEEERIIKFTASIEGVGDEGMEGEYAEVRKQLTQFIYEKFFEPKINPKALLDRDTPGSIVALLSGVRDTGLPMQFGGSKRELNVEQRRSFEADVSTYRAVERMIAPQGHLSMFWEDFNLSRDQVITVVDEKDDVWRISELGVTAVANFDDNAVAHIVVDIVYGGLTDGRPAQDARTFSLVLDKEHRKGTVRNWYDPDVGARFHYRFTVAFGPGAVVGDDVLVTSEWMEAEGREVTVDPRMLIEQRSYEFQRSSLLKGRFPEVLVRLKYTDPQTGWQYDRAKLLNDETPSWTAEFRVRKGAPLAAAYDAQFVSEDGTINQADRPAGTLVTLNDPRENLVKIKLMVADRQNFQHAIVNLEHADPDHDIFESETVVITTDDVNGDHEWQFRRAPGARARYRYNFILLKTDGSLLETDWVETEAPSLMIGDRTARIWSIRPQLVGPALAQNGLERITVALAYEDAGNDYRAAKDLVFAAPGEAGSLDLNLKNPALRDYTYSVIYKRTNGFDRRVGPVSSRDTFPVISTVPPT